jgi:uncharacterized protein YecE (DUF72 family)
MEGLTMSVRVGCCGFGMARREYFRRFPLVEVQQTFYQPPRPETLRRWRAEAPETFEFSVKAWQLITHPPTSPTYRRLRAPIAAGRREHYGAFRPTAEVTQAWEATLAAARCLAARAVLFQCPASFQPTAENLANLRGFFAQLRPQAEGLRLVWEPRGPWPRELVAELCLELGLIPAVDPFQDLPYPDLPRYFRLHGGPGYRHRYGDAELTRLLGWTRGEGYCLFNNLGMAEDAARLLRLLKLRRPDAAA